MGLAVDLLRQLMSLEPDAAWKVAFEHAWQTCAQPIPAERAQRDIKRRDECMGELDLFLTTGGWDLWSRFESSVEHTADALVDWWGHQSGGRAALILDALSLREAPWILHEASRRGYTVRSARATAAELPADTTRFAKALGFAQRSSLANNGAGPSHRLSKARTDAVGLPWHDCVPLIDAEPAWVLWHQWLDDKVHELKEAGQGLDLLVQVAATELTGDPFWALVERLTTGRRLVITSDHGYAASGRFVDSDETQAKFFRERFGSSRFKAAPDGAEAPQWAPPLDLTLSSRHGRYQYALGRRKWKSPGGYPTLTHGGLSILEVASPFIEVSRTE